MNRSISSARGRLAWLTILPSLVALTVLAGSESPGRAQPRDDVAAAARAVLQAHCYACHGQDGRAESGVYVLDRDKLVARRKVKLGQPDDSPLLEAMASGSMPPKDDHGRAITARPGKDEVAAVRAWIAAGAPPFPGATPKRAFVSNAQILEYIRADLERADERTRRFLRYFTLTHLANAGKSEEELLSHRAGLSKLVNSLSWNAEVTPPVPVDPGKTVLRIDLRDYEWTTATWDAILRRNPYGVTYPNSATAKACYALAQCPLPHVRGDWFVFAASQPPLYHTVLELPADVAKLEERLRIDRAKNIASDRVARAGFNGSGVSKNNRLIERHQSSLTGGAYWISYDFAGKTGKQNLFEHPLDFQQDGGEIIFNLPNGLQAYLLIDAAGKRIDQGPIRIVSDPDQPDRTVTNGISCMKCHADGMRLKADQVREAVEASPGSYTDAELKTVRALYPDRDAFERLQRKDAERYLKAAASTGAQRSRTEPVYVLARQFDAEMDLPTAAAEAGTTPDAFLKALADAPALGRVFAPLRTKGGTVGREVFVEAFGGLVRHLERDAVPQGDLVRGEPTPGQVRGFEVAPGVYMDFCWIPPGECRLGSPKAEQDYITKTFFEGKRLPGLDGLDIEADWRRGTFKAKGFWMGKYPVTQAEWEAVTGSNPSVFDGRKENKAKGLDTSRFPVDRVSWNDCQKFLDALNRRPDAAKTFGRPGKFRLPHENEWEYACRGGRGNGQAFYWGNELNGTQANCRGSTPYGTVTKGPNLERTSVVGSYEATFPHPWGLCDMHGNVSQWCDNPLEHQPGLRAQRGGAWDYGAQFNRAAHRSGGAPNGTFNDPGLRVLLSPE